MDVYEFKASQDAEDGARMTSLSFDSPLGCNGHLCFAYFPRSSTS